MMEPGLLTCEYSRAVHRRGPRTLTAHGAIGNALRASALHPLLVAAQTSEKQDDGWQEQNVADKRGGDRRHEELAE
jgi:hypothetical protein